MNLLCFRGILAYLEGKIQREVKKTGKIFVISHFAVDQSGPGRSRAARTPREGRWEGLYGGTPDGLRWTAKETKERA